MKRIGLLGGSFNPAHRGHRRVTLSVIRALALDEAWWLVSPGNPLKPRAGMAPFAARLASARAMARRAPIRASDLETRLHTRYTVDTLRAIRRRHPRDRFVWIMGADNLAQFHEWYQWRSIARTMPIAVVTRPGYDARARAAPAMGWLRRYRRPAGQARNWAEWSVPALVLLRFRPDRTSATQIRAVDPDWHVRFTAITTVDECPAATSRQPQE
ncbi:nicotinate-nucleotide adenylyltransferase [Sphingomonas endophytica]|uniref:Probable nicotinate-nucleotide adenylyltransferase n=1 Tax=Sphingomonas endophytica TaxID=869719 RepID=A0A147I0M4_9SPHN|nr:nicotinate-nucleotide adenylyltransferase [Sphingomonas endophytica]KTT70983.1 nicotinate-nucleotide adenylyltransferase [Sphingomonas endophytica]